MESLDLKFTLYEKWLYNLKIHYIWTFFSSILFLSPIITLYYKYFWLTIHDIVVLSSIFLFFSSLFEIPTSTLGDTIWRVKVMKLSVLSSFVSIVLIFLFPNYFVFFIATIFSALWQALWSWTWHAKLQEDLQAAEMQKDFWKVIWKLIALENIWKLITPIGIYFILKYFNDGYRILAFLDILFYSIWVFFVFKFIEIWRVDKYRDFSDFYSVQVQTLKSWLKFFLSNKSLFNLLFVMILWNDLWYLARVLLPSLVENGVKSFLTSYIVWFSIFAWITWNLLVSKISKKISYKKLLKFLILINSFLHFLAYYFDNNNLILSVCFIFISFVIWIYVPVWNHILMSETDIKEKATVRSLFLTILWLFESAFLFVFSFFSFKTVLLILSILMFISFLIGWFLLNC